MKSVPTDKDWGIWSDTDLDAAAAYRMFGGKTNVQMQAEFSRNVIERVSDLRSMPERPFQYYVAGLRDYVLARKFRRLDSSDAASCFLELILEKLECQPERIVPVMGELTEAISFVAEHQKEYDADEDIYGNFLDLKERIFELYETMA